MNYIVNMTDILLAVSIGYNLWFLLLLLYERIMDRLLCTSPSPRDLLQLGR